MVIIRDSLIVNALFAVHPYELFGIVFRVTWHAAIIADPHATSFAGITITFTPTGSETARIARDVLPTAVAYGFVFVEVGVVPMHVAHVAPTISAPY